MLLLSNAVTATQPLEGIGSILFCPDCYPMLASPTCPDVWEQGDSLIVEDKPRQFHEGHYRHGFANSRNIDIYDGSVKLNHVEEAVWLSRVPGLLVREFVTDADDRYVLCRRNGHTTLMRRLRYLPGGFIVRTQP